MDTNAVMDLMWVLICGILVFFMQAGFTLVETGFARSKNTGNIIMKNLMDFCIGSVAFWAIGYSLMYGDSISGFIGTPSWFFQSTKDMHSLFFQTVFAATAATIVSGAIAERTKFSTYLIFSLLMTLVIYPISGSWVWNAGGWLAKMGFTDFAGSTVVHSVGGWASLVAAAMVGPRIGKYNADGTANAIPGHSLMLGALGVFILWVGWFGFNPGSQLAISGDNAFKVATIFITTNLAGASGALAAMFVTWAVYKKPDISMTLNGVLAGLVGVIAVVFSIEFIDKKLKIDDPVGAVSVHGVCGALGTLLVGVFATDGGLLYGGGFAKLGVQAIGVLSIGAWAMGASFIVIFILKKTMGIRVTKEEEIDGLDIHEHGSNCYNE
jgi:ammonium transporter, Amt family